MRGEELAARYAFPPNQKRYCGEPTFRRALLRNLERGGGIAALGREIRKFRVHYSYLSLIARENGLKPFDLEVVKAFWIGNGLLESVGRSSLERFIREDLFQGRENARVRRLCAGIPEGSLPHHSFNSLYVNFVTDSVERSVENMDSCCVTWGNVLSLQEDRAVIARNAVSLSAHGFSLRGKKTALDLERSGVRLAGRLEKGDILSAHWGMAVQKISRRDSAALKKYTMMNIKAVNESSKVV